MLRITGLIHVCNHERQVGRALLSLRPCDEVLVVDHGSTDATRRVAREHGARIIQAASSADHGSYAQRAGNDWIFCLLPCEAIAEDLEASLLEWKVASAGDDHVGYNIGIREQTGTEWKLLKPELRLVKRTKVNWAENVPALEANAPTLAGYILRIQNRDE
ncbi:MAG TPA: hypothetical protein VI636_18200 [Candidatus Angelobacter sp.]